MHLEKSAGTRTAFLVLALGVALAVGGSFLDNPIVFDDYYFFNLGTPEAFFADGPRFATRWWVYETFAATVVFLGQELYWLRLGNLAAHLATAVALYFLVKRLLTDLDAPAEGKRDVDAVAFLASMFFLLHPLAMFAQGYLTQRTTVMATLFSLLTVLTFWRGLGGSPARLWLSCLFCFLSIYAKEHAVMLPAVCGAFWMLRARSGLASPIPRAKIVGALLLQTVVAGLAVLQVKGLIGGAWESLTREILAFEIPIDPDLLYPLSVLNQAGLFFKYLSLWMYPDPAGLSIDMREPFPLDFSSASLWLGAACYLAYGAACAVLVTRGRVAGLLGVALLAPWLMFFTEFSSARVQEPFVLYRSYLWMPSLFIVLALGARRLSGFLFVVLGVLGATALTALSIDRLTTLSHPYLVWNEAAVLLEKRGITPGVFGAYRIYYNRGRAAYHEGMQDKALADFEKVIRIKPDYAHAYHQRGTIWLSRKQWERAAADFERAIVLLPTHVKSYRGRMKALEAMGRQEEARETAEFACVLEPSAADCRREGHS